MATTAAVTTIGVNASLNGTTITTGLGYPNPGGSPSGGGGGINSVFYVGSTITVTGSGCTSGSPCTWTLLDQNGDTVSTISTTAQIGPVTPLGQISCTGSAANTVCVYHAPFEYPSTPALTINVTDGTNASQISVDFSYYDQMNEYFTHRGRTLWACTSANCATSQIVNNLPWTVYGLTTATVTQNAQPMQINFLDTFNSQVSGVAQTAVPIPEPIEMSIWTISSDTGFGAQVPISAGSKINRPAFTYNGQWLVWASFTYIPGASYGSNLLAQKSNGSAMQFIEFSCVPDGYAFTPDKVHPSYLVTNDNTHIYVCDLNNSQTRTAIANHSLNVATIPTCGFECPGAFSYMGGPNDTMYSVKTLNNQFPTTMHVSNTSLTSNIASYTYTVTGSVIPFVGLNVNITGTTNGGGVFNVTGGTLTITNTVSSGGIATYTYTGTPAPLIGAAVYVSNTTNGGGVFNVSSATITAVGAGNFSVSLATSVSSATDSGTAIYGYPITSISGGIFTIPLLSANVVSAADSGTATIPGCYPIQPACSVYMQTFDLTSCYTALSSSCATSVGEWNSNFNLNYGWLTSGQLHCTAIDTLTNPPANCEWHFHDIYYLPKTNDFTGFYGAGGSVGETIFYQFSNSSSTSSSNIELLSPNTETNMYAWGHPAWNASNPYLVAADTQAYCNASGPQVTPHTCTSTNAGGNYVFDTRFPTVTLAFSSQNTNIGHIAWDGYYLGYFGHDSGEQAASDLIVQPGQNSNGCYTETLSEENLATATRTVLHSFGCQPLGTSSPTLIPAYDLSPAQSPDATKLVYSMQTSQTYNTSCSTNKCGVLVGWMFFTHRPAPPINVRLGSSSSALISFSAAPLNRETQNYWIYKQPSCTGAWSRLGNQSQSITFPSAIATPVTYTYTDSTLGSGSNACYGVTSQEYSGQESDHLSNVIKVTNTGGVFTATFQQGEGTQNFAPIGVSNVTGMTVTQKALCATGCAAVNTPSAPSLVAAAGSLTGEYWVAVSYCKYLDFPQNQNPVCTPVGNMSHITLASQGIAVSTSKSEMVGHDAVQVYMFGPSSTAPAASAMFLQTATSCTNGTIPAPTLYLNAGTAGAGSLVDCTFGTYVGSGSAPPTTNNTVGGYRITWNDAGGVGDRYDQIYYRENAPVILSGGELAAQPQLIATPPVGTQTWYDGFSNQSVPASNIHYAIVTKRMDGTRSLGVCMNGAGVGETCG